MCQSGIEFAHTPETIIEIITPLNQIIDRQESADCRRILSRRRLTVPIRLQLVGADMQPCSQWLEGLSQDVTMGGLGFLCACEVTTPYALVQFYDDLGAHQPLLIEIKHVKCMGPFCQAGGPFIVDWS